MNIERSSLQTQAGFANTGSMREQVLDGLQSSKEYRHAFVEESIRTRITAQIKALRDAERWDYRQFAEKINKKVSWTYRLEDPNAPPPTIPTLLQVAAAFDIGLDVRFRSFSELLADVTTLGPQSFGVPAFEQEMKAGWFSTKKHRRRVHVNNRRRKLKAGMVAARPALENVVSIGAGIGANIPQTLPAAS